MYTFALVHKSSIRVDNMHIQPSQSIFLRKAALMTWLGFLFVIIVSLFWYNAWLYDLPTPVPAGYKPISTGSVISLPANLKTGNNKPLFLHFFNPDCPCSRFNIAQFKLLVKQYGAQVNFVIVPIVKKPYTAGQIQEKFQLDLPVLFDTTLAATCGVYSTPQAVIIGAGNILHYRGNYNRSRYCADEKTNYARIAIENLLTNKTTTAFNQFALTAYGCGLPNCTKK